MAVHSTGREIKYGGTAFHSCDLQATVRRRGLDRDRELLSEMSLEEAAVVRRQRSW
jgi:hypothetical protein